MTADLRDRFLDAWMCCARSEQSNSRKRYGKHRIPEKVKVSPWQDRKEWPLTRLVAKESSLCAAA